MPQNGHHGSPKLFASMANKLYQENALIIRQGIMNRLFFLVDVLEIQQKMSIVIGFGQTGVKGRCARLIVVLYRQRGFGLVMRRTNQSVNFSRNRRWKHVIVKSGIVIYIGRNGL